MANIVGKITALLDIDDSKFSAKMTRAGKDFKDLHGKFSTTSKGVFAAGQMVASGLAALGVGAFLNDSIAAMRGQEVATARLQQAMANTGASWSSYADNIRAANSAAVEMGYTDDEMTAALAKLTTMTGSVNTALGDQTLIMDLARTTGMDLAASASLIAKVEEGRIGIAARQLPFLHAQMTREEALAALRKATAGQAEAFAATSAGANAKMLASYDELQEGIGSALLPTMNTLVGSATDLMGAFNSLSPAVRDGGVLLGVYAVGAAAATSAAGGLATGMAALGVAGTGVIAAFVGFIALSAALTAVMARTVGGTQAWVFENTALGESFQQGVQKPILEAMPWLRGVTDLYYGAGYSARVLGESTTSAAPPMSALGIETQGTADATDALNDALVYSTQILTTEQGAEQRALQDKVALKRAQKALADAVHDYGKESTEAQLARLDLTEAENRSKDSSKVAVEATNAAAAAAALGVTGWKNLGAAIRAANSAMRDSPGARIITVGGGYRPALAGGGIVSGPSSGYPATLHGTEAVLPLNDPPRAREIAAAAGISGGGGDVYNFNGNVEMRASDLAEVRDITDFFSMLKVRARMAGV
jgi:hypothetical protein